MSGYETAVRGTLKLKRHSEAIAADEKKRRKKKKNKANNEEETGPAVADLPPELADDPEAVAAAAAIQEGKKPADAILSAKDGAAAGAADAGSEAAASPEEASAAAQTSAQDEGEERSKARTDSRSRSRDPSKPSDAADELEAFIAEMNPRWTPAERAFYLARKAREAERIKKQLELTHRQRMEKFNKHLASLSERELQKQL
ncbi:hypothetical protein, conserved [Eimeria tenella]|uniref:Uncharacterized protein n=1 Tax=Eimeria tenella TaxID=5802 RepID=U6KIU0_EIMTE|nr:hypothetical protein, conserved [Eimeria tenella]CDJ37940.1 hypothetical protein, conserved [Eimeria tenella]|eukprot:XP_013228778.1 hypothetical protein, conserved [Eimeria tenella]